MKDNQKRHQEKAFKTKFKRPTSAAMIRRPDIIIVCLISFQKKGKVSLTLISASWSRISLIAPEPELHTGESGSALRITNCQDRVGWKNQFISKQFDFKQ